MTIEKLSLINFTVFEKLDLRFGKGINVLVGTNGTGKTHLLKLMYALCERLRQEGKDRVFLAQPYFSVSPSALQHTNDEISKAELFFDRNDSIAYHITGFGDGVELLEVADLMDSPHPTKSIFIPAKEMLSHSKGFLALANKYQIPFDKTYVDVITNAELPEAKKQSSLNNKLLKKISNVIQGEVIHENGAFYIVKKSGKKLEFPVEAEGLRKFGLLWKLLKNGLLEKGTVLFWDEPEANINPELMPVLVDLLLELERNGVQVFLATHSYNVAKYFEVKRDKQDDVLYHYLYKTDHGVKAESHAYFGELEHNPIVEADAKLLDEVIEEQFNE